MKTVWLDPGLSEGLYEDKETEVLPGLGFVYS